MKRVKKSILAFKLIINSARDKSYYQYLIYYIKYLYKIYMKLVLSLNI